MSLLWFDGFENSTEAPIASKGEISSIIYQGTLGTGRSGTHGYDINAGWIYRVNFTNNQTNLIVGAAIKFNASANGVIAEMYDGNEKQLIFEKVGTEIRVTRAWGDILGTSSGGGLSVGDWRYLEIGVVISNSAGIVTIKSDETVVLSVTGADTQYTANARINAIRFTATGAGESFTIDDVYMLNSSAPAPYDDFLGNVCVDVIRPNASGTYSDFTPSSGSNYQNVDEASQDDMATYNSSSTVGHKDTYNLGSVPAPSGLDIYAVKVQSIVKKDTAGTRACKLLSRSGTTDHLDDDECVLDVTFKSFCEILELNPDDSAAWEEADVNALETGIQVTS
jgi:hypothetical protein